MYLSQEEANELLVGIDGGEYSGEIERAVNVNDERGAVVERVYDRIMDDCRSVVDEDDIDRWQALEQQGVTAEHVENWLNELWDEFAQDTV